MRIPLRGRRGRWSGLMLLGAALVVGATSRTRADFITDHLAGPAVRVHGSGADGTLNIVILGDGFTSDAASIGAYRDAADRAVTELLATDPFQALAGALTIYRVDVVSDEAGIDVPADCGGVPFDPPVPFPYARSEKHPDNALETHWCESGVKWFLGSDAGSDRVAQFALTAGVVPDITVVLVNDWMFGATAWSDPGVLFVSISQNLVGDLNPDTGVALEPNDAESFPAVLVHETGHMAPFRLLDEYSKGRDPAQLNKDEADLISNSPNLNLADQPLKWEALLSSPKPPIPTDCDAENPPEVGAVPGGRGFDTGVYHAQCACRMDAFNHPTFCVVCRQRLFNTLSRHLPLIGLSAPRRLPRSGVDIWAFIDSLTLKNGPSGRYSLEYAIAVGGNRASGSWPGGPGVLLRRAKTVVIGEILTVTGPPPELLPSTSAAAGPTEPSVTFEYRLMWRPTGGEGGRSSAIAEERHQIPLSLLRSKFVAVDRPTHRITLAVVSGR